MSNPLTLKTFFLLHTKTTPIVTNVGSMVGHVKQLDNLTTTMKEKFPP